MLKKNKQAMRIIRRRRNFKSHNRKLPWRQLLYVLKEIPPTDYAFFTGHDAHLKEFRHEKKG